jgi:hypothetical protein
VNFNHALNDGRKAWYLTLPHSSGGKTFFDLIGMYPLAISGLGTNSGWTTSNRHGGSGCIRFADIGAGANLMVPNPLKLGLPITYGCWVRAFGAPDANASYFGETYDNANSNPYTIYGFYNNAGVVGVGLNFSGTALGWSSGYTLTSAWTRLVAVHTVTGIAFYVNGEPFASDSITLTNPTSSSTSVIAIGNETGVSRNSNIDIDDCFVNQAAWSPAMVALDYDQSLRGYPDALNWS